MAKSKRACYLCGSKYEYCDCNRQPAYMATFCSENCRDIFRSLSSYGAGLISAEDCKELLDCCDLSSKDSYKESIRNTINNFYATPVVTIEEPEVVVAEPIVEEQIEETVIEPVVIEEIVPEYFERKSKKRNHEVVLEDI